MTIRPGDTATWWGKTRRVAVPRLDPAPIGVAIFLGVLALVVPLLGPVTWVFANEQLDRVARGFAAHAGVGWLRFARVCGMIASYTVLAAITALIVILI
ncbi:MAG: hypothetical protein WKG01_41485 [Kofleriaceae bacterium]